MAQITKNGGVNTLVFKRQLLNQLSCLSQTETGMLGQFEGVEGQIRR